MTEAFWFKDRRAWRLILLGYVPWLAGLNLATLWYEAEPAYISLSVLHCTLGDVLIGAAALITALIATREDSLAQWRWRRIAALTAIVGAGYTVFSEWMNLTILRSWTYAESMPRLALAGFELGVTPLEQWLVVPPLALYLCRARLSRNLA